MVVQSPSKEVFHQLERDSLSQNGLAVQQRSTLGTTQLETCYVAVSSLSGHSCFDLFKLFQADIPRLLLCSWVMAVPQKGGVSGKNIKAKFLVGSCCQNPSPKRVKKWEANTLQHLLFFGRSAVFLGYVSLLHLLLSWEKALQRSSSLYYVMAEWLLSYLV